MGDRGWNGFLPKPRPEVGLSCRDCGGGIQVDTSRSTSAHRRYFCPKCGIGGLPLALVDPAVLLPEEVRAKMTKRDRQMLATAIGPFTNDHLRSPHTPKYLRLVQIAWEAVQVVKKRRRKKLPETKKIEGLKAEVGEAPKHPVIDAVFEASKKKYGDPTGDRVVVGKKRISTISEILKQQITPQIQEQLRESSFLVHLVQNRRKIESAFFPMKHAQSQETRRVLLSKTLQGYLADATVQLPRSGSFTISRERIQTVSSYFAREALPSHGSAVFDIVPCMIVKVDRACGTPLHDQIIWAANHCGFWVSVERPAAYDLWLFRFIADWDLCEEHRRVLVGTKGMNPPMPGGAVASAEHRQRTAGEHEEKKRRLQEELNAIDSLKRNHRRLKRQKKKELLQFRKERDKLVGAICEHVLVQPDLVATALKISITRNTIDGWRGWWETMKDCTLDPSRVILFAKEMVSSSQRKRLDQLPSGK